MTPAASVTSPRTSCSRGDDVMSGEAQIECDRRIAASRDRFGKCQADEAGAAGDQYAAHCDPADTRIALL
jgi:hypothetical protein